MSRNEILSFNHGGKILSGSRPCLPSILGGCPADFLYITAASAAWPPPTAKDHEEKGGLRGYGGLGANMTPQGSPHCCPKQNEGC